MSKITVFFCLTLLVFQFKAQNYTSYLTGNTTDLVTNPLGGVCLMGGATEDDEAIKWFLNRASGGDILVLRASGSDGYNNYFYSDLGISVNSVETIKFNNAQASSDPYVLDKIKKAEAIWITGGDQWDYISYWRDSPVDSLINKSIVERNLVIGGTSAGMAILGSHYFSAQNGTITSSDALQNPYSNNLTIDYAPFLKAPHMSGVITDTHYDNPDREGRHSVFIARFLADSGIEVRGIACDEYTAVCIDLNGIARVFGGYPTYDDNAYFIQINCELSNINPETLVVNQPVTWDRGNQALKVYAIKGTSTGSNFFDLNDWFTGSGGEWENWYIINGVLNKAPGTSVNCFHASTESNEVYEFDVFPNPVLDILQVKINHVGESVLTIMTSGGKIVQQVPFMANNEAMEVNVEDLERGVYLIICTNQLSESKIKRIVKL